MSRVREMLIKINEIQWMGVFVSVLRVSIADPHSEFSFPKFAAFFLATGIC